VATGRRSKAFSGCRQHFEADSAQLTVIVVITAALRELSRRRWLRRRQLPHRLEGQQHPPPMLQNLDPVHRHKYGVQLQYSIGHLAADLGGPGTSGGIQDADNASINEPVDDELNDSCSCLDRKKTQTRERG
jgi:hypothetical protein